MYDDGRREATYRLPIGPGRNLEEAEVRVQIVDRVEDGRSRELGDGRGQTELCQGLRTVIGVGTGW